MSINYYQEGRDARFEGKPLLSAGAFTHKDYFLEFKRGWDAQDALIKEVKLLKAVRIQTLMDQGRSDREAFIIAHGELRDEAYAQAQAQKQKQKEREV